MRYRIKENSWLVRLAAKGMKAEKLAMVLGSNIHLYNTTREEFLADERWLRHELKHIEQFKRYGIVGYLVKYTVASIRYGYYNNPFEVEAREAEDAPTL